MEWMRIELIRIGFQPIVLPMNYHSMLLPRFELGLRDFSWIEIRLLKVPTPCRLDYRSFSYGACRDFTCTIGCLPYSIMYCIMAATDWHVITSYHCLQYLWHLETDLLILTSIPHFLQGRNENRTHISRYLLFCRRAHHPLCHPSLCGMQELNPHPMLGRHESCHWTNSAIFSYRFAWFLLWT